MNWVWLVLFILAMFELHGIGKSLDKLIELLTRERNSHA